jgi:hypothetical protein
MKAGHDGDEKQLAVNWKISFVPGFQTHRSRS